MTTKAIHSYKRVDNSRTVRVVIRKADEIMGITSMPFFTAMTYCLLFENGQMDDSDVTATIES